MDGYSIDRSMFDTVLVGRWLSVHMCGGHGKFGYHAYGDYFFPDGSRSKSVMVV